jgi:hypothetical protein
MKIQKSTVFTNGEAKVNVSTQIIHISAQFVAELTRAQIRAEQFFERNCIQAEDGDKVKLILVPGLEGDLPTEQAFENCKFIDELYKQIVE